MTDRQIRLAEECLYMRKYLYGKMQELAIIIDAMMPQAPGSVVKMEGKPAAKTPMDTSETEHWGVARATCQEAEEHYAKNLLFKALAPMISERPAKDQELVRLLYDKEYPPRKVKEEMGIDHREYYAIRLRVLRNVWRRIKGISYFLDLALQ